MIKLKVKTEINPTEDIDKIKEAITHLYEFSEFSISDLDKKGIQIISAEVTGVESLYGLFNQVRRQRIVQTIRNQILSEMDVNNHEVDFMINKQALTRGKISYCTTPSESPLGPIHIHISSNNIERLMDYLFPETKDGKVLEANYTPQD